MKQIAVDKPVQRAVDKLLLEQGSYTPLELLLAEGRLLFADYEAWREAQSRYLDESLFGDPGQIQALLQQAAVYAEALGLEAESFSYPRWGGGGDLQFSREIDFDRLFHTRYRKPADVPQMDLFMDATGSILVKGIQAALVGRDFAEARRQLDLLFDADPGNHRLGGLEQLVEATLKLDLAVEDAAGEQAYLEQELRPLAVDLLGPASRDFLASFWRRLIQAVWHEDFDAGQPERHASYMAIQVEAWDLVQQSIESVTDWTAHPFLLRRYAQACGRLQQSDQAVCCWFRFCWAFADQAGAIGTEAEPAWRHRWQCFLGLDPELDNRDFPAWSLLEQPGLVKRLALVGCLADVKVPEDYRVTAKLVTASTSDTPASDLIEQRRHLQTLNPKLFGHYLERFGRG